MSQLTDELHQIVSYFHCTYIGEDHPRRTGRTFRCVLQALVWASEGGGVVFIATHPRHAVDRTRMVLEAWGIDYEMVKESRRIRIKGAYGGISFHGEDVQMDKVRGHRYLVVDRDD